MSLIRFLAFQLLNFYLAIRYRRSFNSLQIDSEAVARQIDLEKPVLLIANHISWWDGFFALEIYKKLKSKKDFKIVMLESELKKFQFFRLCGAVGLIPRNRAHNQEIFNGLKGHFVCFFPEGQIMPQHLRPLHFKSGLEKLIETLHPVQILPVALHIEPFQFMRPTALIKLGPLIASESHGANVSNLAALVEKNLNEVCLEWTSELCRLKDSEWK